MSPNLLKTFVQNRVVQINELTGDKPWRHVAGKQNPADLLSRGVHLDVLKSCELWWRGPPFLQVPNTQWEYDIISDKVSHDELPELKSLKTSLLVQVNSDNSIFERYSCFNRLRRVVAYIMRFVNNSRTKLKTQRLTGCLSVEELNISVRVLTRLAQQQSLSNIYTQLKEKGQLKCPRNISSLNIFFDDHRLIRVGGRIEYSDLVLV